jgi:hypothetical protein
MYGGGRQVRTWLLLLLVACGGGKASAPTTPTRSAAVVELAGKADAVCACPSDGGECAGDAFGVLLERQAELMTPAEQEGLDAEHDRAVVCFVDKSGRPRGLEFVAAFSGTVDKICACADAACVQSVMEAFGPEAARYENAIFTAREQRLMGEKGHKASECLKRFASETAPPTQAGPSVAIAERVATQICACPSLDCAVEAAQKGKAELDEVAISDSEDDQQRVQAAGQKAFACMDALRGR